MNTFEGYSGITWGNGQFVHDFLMVSLILLVSVFAYCFRAFFVLFVKMIRGFVSVKVRQNLFDTPTTGSIFFNGFMGFQALFLCSVFFFISFSRLSGIQEQATRQAFILLAVFFILILLFYLLKRFLYFTYSSVFIDKSKFSLWNTTYHALFSLWGILLYLPVFWLMLDRERFTGAIFLFFFIFILFRIIAIYVKIRIFYHKNYGFLYLILYLCAQEIIPLLFLYESLTYLHNVIEASILWQ